MNHRLQRMGILPHLIIAALCVSATGIFVNSHFAQSRKKAGATQTTATVKKLKISLNQDCEVLITNSQGKRVGYDPAGKQILNEIPGAEVPEPGAYPSFALPADDPNNPYRINLTSISTKQDLRADLVITGAGFVAGFKGLRLTAGNELLMTFTSDGRRLSFKAGKAVQKPVLFVATQPGRGKPSYVFEVGDSFLSTGTTIAMTLDMEQQRIYFKVDDVLRNKYSVMMRLVNPDKSKSTFLRKDIQYGKSDNYRLDFGNWDGKSALCLYVDDKGDGFDGKECMKLSSQ